MLPRARMSSEGRWGRSRPSGVAVSPQKYTDSIVNAKSPYVPNSLLRRGLRLEDRCVPEGKERPDREAGVLAEVVGEVGNEGAAGILEVEEGAQGEAQPVIARGPARPALPGCADPGSSVSPWA